MLTPGVPKDFLRACVMLLLYERPDHGYDLLERLSELGFDGADPGGVYRVLRRLEKEGLVSSAWSRSEHGGPRCRTYHLSPDGRAELELRARELAEGERRVETFLGRYLVVRRQEGVASHVVAGSGDATAAL